MSKNAQRNFNYLLLAIGLIIVTFLIYVGYRISLTEHKIFSISFIALLAGVLFESFRITDSWITVIFIFIGSLIFSLISFLPGKHDISYEFENHLETWPKVFLFLFALATTIWHRDATIAKLTEGITLMQTMAIIYWVFDYGIVNIDNWFVRILLIIALLFSLLSFFNALTHFTLSRTTRLTLSIWSTIIMLLFAIDYIYRIYENEDIEASKHFSQGLYIGIQFFLLGVSTIYIIQNVIMIMGFLPNKYSSSKAQYFRDLRELKNIHIERYSDQQVHIGHSILCILIIGTIYWLNYKYQYLPRDTAIWLGFVIFPIILRLTSISKRR
jgi:hypothetical protein